MTTPKRPWQTPIALVRPVAALEKLLAEAYGAQAKAWAAASRAPSPPPQR